MSPERDSADSHEPKADLASEAPVLNGQCDAASASESDISDCLDFIERVRQESPHCLEGLVLPSGQTPIAGDRQPDDSADVLQDFWLAVSEDEPANIGRFSIRRTLGEGGFGLVFLAFDPELDREVALKVPRVETLVTRETRARFLQEGKTAARLDHHNIATVYEAGQVGPICYIVSAYCCGGSLADLLKSHPAILNDSESADEVAWFRGVATLVMKLARAVQHAHGRGILHRDLKPGNILFDSRFDREQSQPADQLTGLADAARIVDFGLAKLLDDNTERTRTGTTLGTASYMSPEQACGDRSLIGRGTDIYSLGAILYELLVGRPPLRKESHFETIVAVKNEDPVTPRVIQRACPRDLEAICLKCLEKDPDHRYSLADDLADDLERFLQGMSVQARPPTMLRRGWRWCKRYPLAAILAAVVLVLAVLGPFAALTQRRLYREARVARDVAGRALYTSDMALAIRDWDDANIARCGDLLKRHLPRAGEPDYRGFEWFYLWRFWQQSERTPVVLHNDALESLALSPDERMLAVGLTDGDLILWDRVESRKLAQWWAHSYRTFSIVFSADGQTLATANVDDEIKLWDVTTQEEKGVFQGSRSIAFSPEDDMVAYRSGEDIAILDPGSVEPRIIHNAHEEGVGCVAFSPDGQLASAGWDGGVQLWDVATGRRRVALAGHTDPIWTMAWSPDGKYIATGDVNGTIMLWDVESASLHRSIRGHTATVNSLAFANDSSALASAGVDNRVKLWSVGTGSQLMDLRGHSGEVTSVVFADSDQCLLTASADGDVRSWRIAGPGARSQDVLEHPAAASSVTFSPDGDRIATGCSDGRIRLWSAKTGELLHDVEAHAGPCWRVRFLSSARGAILVSTGQDGAVRIWDAGLQAVQQELACIPDSPSHVPIAASSDSSMLAFPSTELTVTVLNLADNATVARFTTGRASDIEFSQDGRRLAVLAGKSLSLWDITSGESLSKFAAGSRELTCLSIAPGAGTLAVGSLDRTIKLWDTFMSRPGSESSHRVLSGPASSVWATLFSPDGTFLASAGDDQVIRLWDSATGGQRAVLRGHTASVSDLAFSPDGSILASASDDRYVRLWRAPRVEGSEP